MATRNGKPNKNDTLTGTKGDDTFHGYSGDDLFFGKGGNDTFFGADGHDKFPWNKGNDVINGGDGSDDVLYHESKHGMVVDLKAGTALQVGGGEHDTLVSIESVWGSNYDDSLYGSDRTDEIEYFIPDFTDTTQGAAGLPHLKGGTDFIDGRGGIDMLSYYNDKGAVVIDITKGTVKDGGGHTDHFKHIEQFEGSGFDDVIKGGKKADEIWGLEGEDTITGGKGNDTFHAGQGANSLTGGAGKDVFKYMATLAVDGDVITDFATGTDKLDLSDIDADSSTPDTNEAFVMYALNEHDYSTFDGVKGRLIWYHSDDHTHLIVQGDTDGDLVADFTLQLNGDFYLPGTDFIL